MATELLYAYADSTTDTGWNLGAGSSKWQAVLTNDGDTTYIVFGGTLLVWQGFKMESSALISGDTVDNVKIHAYAQVDANGKKSKLRYRVGGSTSDSSVIIVTNGSYGQITYDMGATNPITAVGWVLDDIDGTNRFEFAINNNSAGGTQYKCTQMWVEVTYTPGATGVSIPVAQYNYRRRRI